MVNTNEKDKIPNPFVFFFLIITKASSIPKSIPIISYIWVGCRLGEAKDLNRENPVLKPFLLR